MAQIDPGQGDHAYLPHHPLPPAARAWYPHPPTLVPRAMAGHGVKIHQVWSPTTCEQLCHESSRVWSGHSVHLPQTPPKPPTPTLTLICACLLGYGGPWWTKKITKFGPLSPVNPLQLFHKSGRLWSGRTVYLPHTRAWTTYIRTNTAWCGLSPGLWRATAEKDRSKILSAHSLYHL